MSGDELRVWEEARLALERHAKLGLQLQGMGLEMVKAAQTTGNPIDGDARLLIKDGVGIEAEARLGLWRLEQGRPKGRNLSKL